MSSSITRAFLPATETREAVGTDRETRAGQRNCARKMIRAVLAEHFAGDRSAQQDGSADQSNPQRGFDQILFDVTRTRLRAEKRVIPTKLWLLKTPNMPKG